MATETKKSTTPRKKGPTTIAREYFDAISNKDLDAAAALWTSGGVDHLIGMVDLKLPHEFKAWFGTLFRAMPDFTFEVESITAQKEKAAVQWRATGTFNGTGKFEGIAPNGARVEMRGCDVLTVRDGEIVDNEAYVNGAELARQLGALPPAGSTAEKAMTGALNVKTAAAEWVQRVRER